MFDTILSFAQRPALFEKSTAKFWNDPHISRHMLEAHLNPSWDAATRRHAFVTRSVAWISRLAPPPDFPKLVDFGCGPGIYAERFYEAGYAVSGVDFSERSVAYAKKHAEEKGYSIRYRMEDYLEYSADEKFDVATLIYCDFGVLAPSERKTVLHNVFTSLQSGGLFIFDVFTPRYHAGREERKGWEYCDSGFYSPDPHVCLSAFYRYDEDNTVLDQSIIITEEAVQRYNIWEHMFTTAELERDLRSAGFDGVEFYGDIAGAEYDENGTVICAVARKK